MNLRTHLSGPLLVALASLTLGACLDARDGDEGGEDAPQTTTEPDPISAYGPAPTAPDETDCATTKEGCPPVEIDPVERVPVVPDPVEPDPTPTCSVDESICQDGSECCSGLCTADGSSYVGGVCTPKRTGGQLCFGGEQCVSGSCIDGACINAECNDIGGSCWNANECCTGLCTWVAYAQGECTAPLPDGDPCWSDSMCAAGLCLDGVCGEEVVPIENCLAEATSCYANSECCTGVCTYSSMSPYVMGACVQPLAAGSTCDESTDCASGACTSGICIATDCSAVGATCKSHDACCTGLCSADGDEAGVCFIPRPAGSVCCKDPACLSGICIDGTCE